MSFRNNPSFSGSLNLRCGLRVFSTRTSVTLCGCAAKDSPAVRFPPAGTSLACLATRTANTLAKRTQVFQKDIAGYRVTCSYVDSTVELEKNPYQDCINAQAALCNPTYISGNPTRKTECKNAVDSMTRGLSSLWKNVRKNCGKWSFDGRIGSVTSSNCNNANNALKANAYYILPDGNKQYLDTAFINSVKAGLWENIV